MRNDAFGNRWSTVVFVSLEGEPLQLVFALPLCAEVMQDSTVVRANCGCIAFSYLSAWGTALLVCVSMPLSVWGGWCYLLLVVAAVRRS